MVDYGEKMTLRQVLRLPLIKTPLSHRKIRQHELLLTLSTYNAPFPQAERIRRGADSAIDIGYDEGDTGMLTSEVANAYRLCHSCSYQ